MCVHAGEKAFIVGSELQRKDRIIAKQQNRIFYIAAIFKTGANAQKKGEIIPDTGRRAFIGKLRAAEAETNGEQKETPVKQQEMEFIDGIAIKRDARGGEHQAKTRGARIGNAPNTVNSIEEARPGGLNTPNCSICRWRTW